MKHKTKSRIVALLMALTMVAVAIAGCSQPAATSTAAPSAPAAAAPAAEAAPSAEAAAPAEEPKTIKIAAFANFTGDNSVDGEYFKRGTQLAVELINEKLGGIQSMGGAKLELVYHDNMTDATMTKTVFEQGLSDPDIAFAIGALGTTYTMAAIPAITKAGVPTFTSGISNTLDEQDCEYLWITGDYGNNMSALNIEFLKFLRENYGTDTTKLGVTYIDNEYSSSVASNFTEMIKPVPELKCVFDQSYPPTVSDLSPVVTALKTAGVEVVYLIPSTQDAKLFAQSMQTFDYHPLILGGGGGMVTPVFGDELGDGVLGVLSLANWIFVQGNVNTDENYKWLVDRYCKLYNDFPGDATPAHLAWLMIIKQVLEATGTTDRETNQKALAEMEFEVPIPSKGGICKFGENRRNENAIYIVCQWQYVEEYDRNIPVCVYPPEFAYADVKFD